MYTIGFNKQQRTYELFGDSHIDDYVAVHEKTSTWNKMQLYVLTMTISTLIDEIIDVSIKGHSLNVATQILEDLKAVSDTRGEDDKPLFKLLADAWKRKDHGCTTPLWLRRLREQENFAIVKSLCKGDIFEARVRLNLHSFEDCKSYNLDKDEVFAMVNFHLSVALDAIKALRVELKDRAALLDANDTLFRDRTRQKRKQEEISASSPEVVSTSSDSDGTAQKYEKEKAVTLLLT